MSAELAPADGYAQDVVSRFYGMVRRLPGLHEVHPRSDFHKVTTGLVANPYFNYYEKLKLYNILRILSAADAGSQESTVSDLFAFYEWLEELPLALKSETKTWSDAVNGLLVRLHAATLAAGDFAPAYFKGTNDLIHEEDELMLSTTGQVIKQLEKDGLITRPDYSGLYAPSLLA